MRSFCAPNAGSWPVGGAEKANICSNKQLLAAKAKNQMPLMMGPAPKPKLPPVGAPQLS